MEERDYFLLGLLKGYIDSSNDVANLLDSIIDKSDGYSVDPDDIAKQADAYVRDHLLIQYMMWKFGKACMLDIEDIYDEWIKWLEEKEEN